MTALQNLLVHRLRSARAAHHREASPVCAEAPTEGEAKPAFTGTEGRETRGGRSGRCLGHLTGTHGKEGGTPGVFTGFTRQAPAWAREALEWGGCGAVCDVRNWLVRSRRRPLADAAGRVAVGWVSGGAGREGAGSIPKKVEARKSIPSARAREECGGGKLCDGTEGRASPREGLRGQGFWDTVGEHG